VRNQEARLLGHVLVLEHYDVWWSVWPNSPMSGLGLLFFRFKDMQ